MGKWRVWVNVAFASLTSWVMLSVKPIEAVRQPQRKSVSPFHHSIISDPRIGDSEDQIKSLYAARVIPHGYVRDGHGLLL